MQVSNQQLELDMKGQTGSKFPGKQFFFFFLNHKGVCCQPAYLTSMQSSSCEMPGWMKHKLDQDCWEKYQ